jgi:hypothetical protein
MALSQEAFEALLDLEKEFSKRDTLDLASNWTRDIKSLTTKDIFQLDYRRGKIEIRKYSFNKRARTSVIMVRYCSLKRHTNPDGTIFDGPHVHIYQEGFGDKIALKVEDVLNINPDAASKEDVLVALMDYCNVKDLPVIQMVLEAE